MAPLFERSPKSLKHCLYLRPLLGQCGSRTWHESCNTKNRRPEKGNAPCEIEEKMEPLTTNSKYQAGFSLIELLVVVAIIGILCALAIPNLIASRRAANEGSALASLRLIHTCEHAYRAATSSPEYGTMSDLRGQFLTDQVLASGTKSGYNFEVNPTTGVNPPQFYLTAVPTIPSGIGQSGTRRFAMTEDGILRADTTLTVPADRTEAEGITPLQN